MQNILTSLKSVLEQLNEEDAASIVAAQIQLRKPGIREHLAYIKTWFTKVSVAISKLEDSKFLITESVEIVRTVQADLGRAPGDGAKAAALKLDQVLRKNVGFSFISRVADILAGNCDIESVLRGEEGYSPAHIAAYAYAPVTYCDVERSFSCYKTLLADNRRTVA